MLEGLGHAGVHLLPEVAGGLPLVGTEAVDPFEQLGLAQAVTVPVLEEAVDDIDDALALPED